MGKSSQLRVGDVRATLRVVGECRDLGHDPGAWRRHAFGGLGRLVGACITAGGEVRWRRPGGPIEPLNAEQVGFSPADFDRYFMGYLRERGPDGDILFGRLKVIPGRHVTRTRRQVLADAEWYRSATYADFYRTVRIDHCAGSLYELPGDRVDQIGLHRAAAERDFSARERRLIHLFHAELGRLVGPVLIAAGDPFSPTRLPPRVREALRCLLEGDSEKQVAARMGVSQPTVHQYVTALYRHYRVSSRAELLARVLRRPPPGA
jgi:DNA-binding CsgD family transcriptional regulator